VACDDSASVKHSKRALNAYSLLAPLLGRRRMKPQTRSPSNLNGRRDALVTDRPIVCDVKLHSLMTFISVLFSRNTLPGRS
jgi:hypothetical protein